MISDFTNIAFKNIRKRRMRAFLTLVGITISIATIFVLISLSLGLEVAIQEQFEILGADKFFIQPRGQFGPPGAATAATLTKDDVEFVSKILGVKEATYYVIGNAKVEYKDTTKFVSIIGLEPENIGIAFGSYKTEENRLLEKGVGREVLLGSQYKYNDFLGKPVDAGNKIQINGVEFKVQGIVESTGSPPDDRQIYMPADEFRILFDIPERVDAIVVQVSDAAQINEVADNTERKLMKFRDVDEKTIDFYILTPEELLSSVKTILNIVTYFLLGIAAISLLVGGINIANTMFTSVLERTKEIGVMKAIGAQNKDILKIFLIEAGLLGIVGGLAGIILGFAINKLIEYIAVNQLSTTLLQTSSPPWLIISSLVFAFAAGAVSGLWPAWRATKIKPVDALRYE